MSKYSAKRVRLSKRYGWKADAEAKVTGLRLRRPMPSYVETRERERERRAMSGGSASQLTTDSAAHSMRAGLGSIGVPVSQVQPS